MNRVWAGGCKSVVSIAQLKADGALVCVVEAMVGWVVWVALRFSKGKVPP